MIWKVLNFRSWNFFFQNQTNFSVSTQFFPKGGILTLLETLHQMFYTLSLLRWITTINSRVVFDFCNVFFFVFPQIKVVWGFWFWCWENVRLGWSRDLRLLFLVLSTCIKLIPRVAGQDHVNHDLGMSCMIRIVDDSFDI